MLVVTLHEQLHHPPFEPKYQPPTSKNTKYILVSPKNSSTQIQHFNHQTTLKSKKFLREGVNPLTLPHIFNEHVRVRSPYIQASLYRNAVNFHFGTMLGSWYRTRPKLPPEAPVMAPRVVYRNQARTDHTSLKTGPRSNGFICTYVITDHGNLHSL